MPSIVSGSISILSDAGLGMAMFSLGNPLTKILIMNLLAFVSFASIFWRREESELGKIMTFTQIFQEIS